MFSTLIAIGTIALQLFIIILAIGLAMRAPFVASIARYSTTLLRLLFAGSIIVSLIYQYGFGYEPCLLCWYQRIAIFAVGIIAWTTSLQKSALLRTQTVVLSLLGLAVAIFHNIIDLFPTGLDVCGATGPSCLARYVYEFGYITIPMMSLTILLIAILLAMAAKRYPQAVVVASLD